MSLLLRLVRAHCWSPRCYFLYYLMSTELCDCAAFRVTEKKKRNTNVLCQAGPGLQTGRWCGHRQRARTHTCRTVWRWRAGRIHTCSCLVCQPCQCFSMSLGQAGCIYYALSEIVLIYHRKNSPVSGNTEWHLVRPDGCDLHTRVEQITKRLGGTLTFFFFFYQEAALWWRKAAQPEATARGRYTQLGCEKYQPPCTSALVKFSKVLKYKHYCFICVILFNKSRQNIHKQLSKY